MRAVRGILVSFMFPESGPASVWMPGFHFVAGVVWGRRPGGGRAAITDGRWPAEGRALNAPCRAGVTEQPISHTQSHH